MACCTPEQSEGQLLDTLVQGTNTTDEQLNADTVIIDVAALINAESTGAEKSLMIMPLSLSYLLLNPVCYSQKHSRIDLFYTYRQDSLKGES